MFFQNIKRAAKTAAIGGVLAITLVACAGNGNGTGDGSAEDPNGSAGEPQLGGTAVLASLGEMPGFDPVKLVALGTGIERAAQVMDTLMYRDDVTGEVRPKLAESLESDDGQEWLLKLRDGVTFTDGTPLDAEAVVFNLERHIAPDSKSAAKSMLSGVQTIEATDDYEVTITLSEPSGSFPLALTGSTSASLIGSPTALENAEAFNSNPVGAGPFIFDSWVRDSELKLVRNDDYFVDGQPYLDAVTYRVLPDTQGRADALLSGDVMFAPVGGNSWASIESNAGFVISPSAVGGQALVPNASKAPGNDERVRRAITLATDPKTTNTILFPGSDLWDGNRDCIPFPDGAAACVEGISPNPDIEEAKALIAEYAAEGGTVAVDYIAPAATDEVSYYQRQLTEIGLDVTLTMSDVGSWLAGRESGDYGVLYDTMGSSGYPTQWRYMYSEGQNWGRITYPELDDALLRARDELKLEDRNAAWQEVAEIGEENSIWHFTAPFASAYAWSTKLHVGTDDAFPFQSTLMLYLGDAWIEQ